MKRGRAGTLRLREVLVQLRRFRRPAGAALVLAVVAAAPALGWGHTGHALINKLAVDALPAGPLKTFFVKHRDYVSAHAIDPDNYKKGHHAEEAPKHFLNIDTD